MNAFFDIEHFSQGPETFVSIGIVRDDDQELHLVSSEFDPDAAEGWFFKAKIWKHIKDEPRYPVAEIARQVREFTVGVSLLITRDGSRDRRQLEAIIGPFPYCNLNTIWEALERPQLPDRGKRRHHALDDARWHRVLYRSLEDVRLRQPLSCVLQRTPGQESEAA